MDQPEKGRLGEGRSVDDDSDGACHRCVLCRCSIPPSFSCLTLTCVGGENDDAMFALPTETSALKYEDERQDEDKKMAATFKEADEDETMDLLKTEGGLDDTRTANAHKHSSKH